MNKPKTRSENIVVQEMDDEILIYDLNDNKAFCLNETSAIIYQLCNGKNSVAEINQQLSGKFKQPISDELIWLALDGLKKDNLLEESEQFDIDFKGLTRRQVIKKVGLSSLVVLPVIASMVAPAAAATASLAALLASCSSPSSCQSGNCVASSAGGLKCCAAGVGGAFTGVEPGSGTCTPTGTCGATYNSTRCCTQMGAVPGAFFCGGIPGFEPCVCL